MGRRQLLVFGGLPVALGTSVGVAWGMREIWLQGYPQLGFWRNAGLELVPRAAQGALLGVLAGAVLVSGLALVQRRRPREQPGFTARETDRIGLLLVGIAVCGALLHLLLRAPTLEVGNPRNLILVGVDTLRLDRTALAARDAGAAERDRLTPSLGRFGRQAAVFTQATSQASWTLPSFASMLTGRYPHEHGARLLKSRLRRRELTLAEVLREAGYRTGAVVSNTLVGSGVGMLQGFDHLDESNVIDASAVTSEDVTDAALAWLDGQRGERFFLFVHYFDPHFEYIDHADWNFSDGYSGWIVQEAPSIFDLRVQAERLGEQDLAYVRALYDEEVAYTDRAIGRLLDGVSSRNLDDQTAVVVVADHGEEFFEHGWLGHAVSLHQAVVNVPLALRLPGVDAAGRVVDAPVETRSLYPTLLDYLEIRGVARGSAPSLLPLIRGQAGAPRDVFSSVWLPDAPAEFGNQVRRSSLRRGNWKLIRNHDSGRDQLYHLGRDPGETRNLAGSATRQRTELSAALDAWLEGAADTAAPLERDLDREDSRRLEALGYLEPRRP